MGALAVEIIGGQGVKADSTICRGFSGFTARFGSMSPRDSLLYILGITSTTLTSGPQPATPRIINTHNKLRAWARCLHRICSSYDRQNSRKSLQDGSRFTSRLCLGFGCVPARLALDNRADSRRCTDP